MVNLQMDMLVNRNLRWCNALRTFIELLVNPSRMFVPDIARKIWRRPEKLRRVSVVSQSPRFVPVSAIVRYDVPIRCDSVAQPVLHQILMGRLISKRQVVPIAAA